MSAKDELEALDYGFNRHGSTMRLDVYNTKRKELVGKCHEEGRTLKLERELAGDHQTPAPAPPPVQSRSSAIKHLLTAEKKAELDAFKTRAAEASKVDDADTLVSLSQDERCAELMSLEKLDEARKLVAESKANVASVLAFALAERERTAMMLAAHAARRRILERRHSELESRISLIEQRKSIDYRGTWNGATEYGVNDATTYLSQLWLCQAQGTRSKPGAGDAWRLVSKTDIAK